MASFHGKNGIIEQANNAVGSVQEWTYSESTDLADDTSMEDTAKTYLPGIPDGGGSFTCLLDPDDATGQRGLSTGDSVSLELMPEGNTSGDFLLSGTVTIESLEYSGSRDGIPTWACTYKGVLSEGTVV